MGNRIAFNGNWGVAVLTGTGNVILGNSIFANATLGIDLAPDGVTPNDAGDADTGSNNLQNFPVLTAAIATGGNTTVTGTFNSTPSTNNFSLEFFSNAACDRVGQRRRAYFLRLDHGQHRCQWQRDHQHDLLTATAPGEFVTATATDPAGNTSEFSECRVVTAPPPPTANLSITKTDAPDPATAGSNLSYTITVINNGPNTATGVAVTDTLPANVGFVSSSASQGTCTGTSTVTCNLGTLSNGASAVVSIVVTPNAAGNLSNTASVTATEADPDTTNNSATATTVVNPAPVITYTISGSITDADGVPVIGVNVALGGSRTATTTTDPNGGYSFSGLAAGGNYTVTPSEVSYVFAPASRTFNNLSANQTTANFNASVPTDITISGRVTDANGNGIAAVNLTFSGAFSLVTETDANGNYLVSNVPANATFTVTPDKTAFSFNPARRVFTNITASQRSDFTGTLQTSPTPLPDPSDDFNAPSHRPESLEHGRLDAAVERVRPRGHRQSDRRPVDHRAASDGERQIVQRLRVSAGS